RSGPYKWLRHPIYTGILVMYVGTALVTGEWLAILGLAMVTFAYWRKIRLEEANLNTAFGADYDAYRRETWALVPGLFWGPGCHPERGRSRRIRAFSMRARNRAYLHAKLSRIKSRCIDSSTARSSRAAHPSTQKLRAGVPGSGTRAPLRMTGFSEARRSVHKA